MLRVSFAQAMSMSSDNSSSDDDRDGLPLQIDETFGSVVSQFPRFRLLAGSFIPPRSFVCKTGERMYLAVCEEPIFGGRKRRKVAVREFLCFTHLVDGNADFLPAEKYGRNHTLPVRLYWLSTDGTLRRARARRRGDAMESLTFTAYRRDATRVEPLLHRVLAFTFCCPPRIWSRVFSATHTLSMNGSDVLSSGDSTLYDVHHVNGDHGDNKLDNLQIMIRDGPGGHRSLSAMEGRRV